MCGRQQEVIFKSDKKKKNPKRSVFIIIKEMSTSAVVCLMYIKALLPE